MDMYGGMKLSVVDKDTKGTRCCCGGTVVWWFGGGMVGCGILVFLPNSTSQSTLYPQCLVDSKSSNSSRNIITKASKARNRPWCT